MHCITHTDIIWLSVSLLPVTKKAFAYFWCVLISSSHALPNDDTVASFDVAWV